VKLVEVGGSAAGVGAFGAGGVGVKASKAARGMVSVGIGVLREEVMFAPLL
jgi:hypothetical protein